MKYYFFVLCIFITGCGSTNKQVTTDKEKIIEHKNENTIQTTSKNTVDNFQKTIKTNVKYPVKINPAIPELIMGMQLHAFDNGWTSDSSEFGYCAEVDGDEDDKNVCVFIHKPFIKTELKYNTSKKYIKQTSSLISYSDISIDWSTNKSNIVIGGNISGESYVADNIVKMPVHNFGIPTIYEIDLHLDTISISPNGEYIGVISHSVGGHDFDELDIKVVYVSKFVGDIYNSTGLHYHKAKIFKKSKELFEKAVSINSDVAIYYYNLACAKSLLGESDVEESLTKAVILDKLPITSEKSIKSRAKKDSDFNSVRSESWFDKLIN